MEMTDYCFSFFRKPIQNIEPMRAIPKLNYLAA